MKLVKFKDLGFNEIHYGIEDGAGNITCACCGGAFENEDKNEFFQVLDEYTIGENDIKEIMEE